MSNNVLTTIKQTFNVKRWLKNGTVRAYVSLTPLIFLALIISIDAVTVISTGGNIDFASNEICYLELVDCKEQWFYEPKPWYVFTEIADDVFENIHALVYDFGQVLLLPLIYFLIYTFFLCSYTIWATRGLAFLFVGNLIDSATRFIGFPIPDYFYMSYVVTGVAGVCFAVALIFSLRSIFTNLYMTKTRKKAKSVDFVTILIKAIRDKLYNMSVGLMAQIARERDCLIEEPEDENDEKP